VRVSKIVVSYGTSMKEKKRKATQAENHALHQLRKRRHIGPKCRDSPPPNKHPIGVRFPHSESISTKMSFYLASTTCVALSTCSFFSTCFDTITTCVAFSTYSFCSSCFDTITTCVAFYTYSFCSCSFDPPP